VATDFFGHVLAQKNGLSLPMIISSAQVPDIDFFIGTPRFRPG
jgi:hypothetical protein